MKMSVEAAFETLQKDGKFLNEHPHVKEQINNEEFKQLIDAIWQDPLRVRCSGSSLEDLIKMVAIHPKKMCTLLGLSDDYEKTYKDVVEDTKTAQALFQCKDITLSSQEPSWFSMFMGNVQTQTIKYSIQVGNKNIILGTTTKSGDNYATSGRNDLGKLALLWINFSKEDTGIKNFSNFIVHLNNRIGTQKTKSPQKQASSLNTPQDTQPQIEPGSSDNAWYLSNLVASLFSRKKPKEKKASQQIELTTYHEDNNPHQRISFNETLEKAAPA